MEIFFEIWKISHFLKFFDFFFNDFPWTLFLQVFELHQQSSNQKLSSWSGQSIGAHHVGVRTVTRELSGSKDERENAIFFEIFTIA